MAKGYIFLHRQILDHWLWSDKPFSKGQAWIDLLLSVNYVPHAFMSKGQLVELKPGQIMTSIQEMQDSWGWSRHKVYRFLNLLEKEKMITRNGTPNGTTITVEKWESYQVQWNADGTANGTPDGTMNGTPDGTLYKNDKNIKKGENSTPPETEEEEIERELRRMRAKYGDDA